jgi:hypothetical protein
MEAAVPWRDRHTGPVAQSNLLNPEVSKKNCFEIKYSL